MLGLAVALLGTARGWWGVVGVGLGVAALLKLSPVMLLVYLALQRKWRALWTAAATMAALLGAALAIGHPDDLSTWFRDVAGSVSEGARTTDNQSLPALLARVFGHTDDIIAQLPLGRWRFGGYVVALVGVVGLWLLRRGQRVEPLDLGVLVLVALLAGPISWDHYLTWSLLVLVLVVDPARWAGRSWLQVTVLAGALGASTILGRRWTSYPLPKQVAANLLYRFSTSEKTYALLLLLGVALWLLLRPAPIAETDAADTAHTADAAAVALHA
jgi:alpha-1,2-mannosyltransferase